MKFARHILPIAALSLLAACATPFTADVSRFQRLPAPTGESFAITAKDPQRRDSLEFSQYAQYVASELSEEGYARASSPEQATLLVELDYGVSDGRERIASRPSSRFGFGYYSPWYSPWYYSPFYDPFWGPSRFRDNDVYSYTVYSSFLDMDIRRKNGEPVFEGRAEATSREGDLTTLVPNLVTAMFTDFPGNSGQTVRVKVPDEE